MSSSSSIPIPTRSHTARNSTAASSYASTASVSLSSLNGSPSTPGNLSKAPVTPQERERIQSRRPSLLGSSLNKSEYTVVDLGHGGAPRLVSCIKSSQGFDWNQELFLPSYMDHEHEELERRQDPVQDIVLTEEEIATMFPQ